MKRLVFVLLITEILHVQAEQSTSIQKLVASGNIMTYDNKTGVCTYPNGRQEKVPEFDYNTDKFQNTIYIRMGKDYAGINIDNTAITSISGIAEIAGRYKNVKSITISGNKSLKKITANVFKGPNYNQLVTLDLMNNSIEEIDKDAFTGLDSVKFIMLSRNKLTTLPRNIFNSLGQLRGLDLSHNRLSSLPDNLIPERAKLAWLHLSGNESLKELPEDIINADVETISMDHSLAEKYLDQLRAKGYGLTVSATEIVFEKQKPTKG